MCCPRQVRVAAYQSRCYVPLDHNPTCLLSVFVFAAALMSEVYDDHKDEDGFLYITYSGENTFG